MLEFTPLLVVGKEKQLTDVTSRNSKKHIVMLDDGGEKKKLFWLWLTPERLKSLKECNWFISPVRWVMEVEFQTSQEHITLDSDITLPKGATLKLFPKTFFLEEDDEITQLLKNL